MLLIQIEENKAKHAIYNFEGYFSQKTMLKQICLQLTVPKGVLYGILRYILCVIIIIGGKLYRRNKCLGSNSNKIYCWHISQPCKLEKSLVDPYLLMWLRTSKAFCVCWGCLYAGRSLMLCILGRTSMVVMVDMPQAYCFTPSAKKLLAYFCASTTKLKSKFIRNQQSDSSILFSYIPMTIISINDTQQ